MQLPPTTANHSDLFCPFLRQTGSKNTQTESRWFIRSNWIGDTVLCNLATLQTQTMKKYKSVLFNSFIHSGRPDFYHIFVMCASRESTWHLKGHRGRMKRMIWWMFKLRVLFSFGLSCVHLRRGGGNTWRCGLYTSGQCMFADIPLIAQLMMVHACAVQPRRETLTVSYMKFQWTPPGHRLDWICFPCRDYHYVRLHIIPIFI